MREEEGSPWSRRSVGAVFRAGLSIKYGELVDLDGAINGPLLHRIFLFFRLGQQRASKKLGK
jgi:hypothetical protein